MSQLNFGRGTSGQGFCLRAPILFVGALRIGKIVSKTSKTRVVGWLLPALLIATGLVAVAPASQSTALSGSEFDPGNIISDELFYDSNAMSQAEIQLFLNAKVGSCTNGRCLNVATFPAVSRPAAISDSTGNIRCGAYNVAGVESAAALIYQAQKACGISAKVLLVTLQKEQALVTSKAPSLAALDRAMGYACPDTGPCTVLGFDAQIYFGALQLSTYRAARFGVQPGVRAVRFHPNVACGSSTVNIRNYATAALYNYTPYQPNAAALANLSGTGDACSSFGNRNFWVFYNNWFGSSALPVGTPEGEITQAAGTGGGISLAGWAIDPDAESSSVRVSIWVDGRWNFQWLADQNFPAASTAFPQASSDHGWGGIIPAAAGNHEVCVYSFNIGLGREGSFGCRSVTVPPNSTPSGYVSAIDLVPGGAKISGWAVDPDALGSSVRMSAWVDGVENYQWEATADSTGYPAVVGMFPAAGASRAYSQMIPVSPGSHRICVYAFNQNAGADIGFSCHQLSLPVNPSPQGAVSKAFGTPGAVVLEGWAIDPDALSGSVRVSVWVDGLVNHSILANTPYANGNKSFPGAGGNHGFSGSVPASTGVHTVCVYAFNSNAGSDAFFSCHTVSVPDPSPQAAVLSATGVVGGVALTGWAVDPDALASPVKMSLWLDGKTNHQWVADSDYPNAESLFPGAGAKHGWSGTLPAQPGNHTVCVYSFNQNLGADAFHGCHTVTVPDASPQGAVLNAVGVAGGIALSGWSIEPDALTSPVRVSLWLDGMTNTQWLADKTYPEGESKFPGAGTSHGWSGTLPASAGKHTVCVYAFNTGAGADAFFSCHSVTVPAGDLSPQGQVLTATPVPGGISLTGWAIDPDALSEPVRISAWLDGLTNSQWLADQSYPGGAVSFPGAGQNHGWSHVVAATPGVHTVCVYAFNQKAGADSFFSCHTVTVL